MKILMLGWELPPYNSGGLGVACYQLCRALAYKQVDIEFVVPYSALHAIDFMRVTAAYPRGANAFVSVAAAYDSHKYTPYEVDGMDVFSLSSAYEKAVEQLVEVQEFEVIHAHDWLTFRAAIRAKERSGKPLIVHVHSVESDRSGGGYGNPLVREIEAITMLTADKIVAVSDLTKRTIVRDYAIPADRIEVVHNSIDLSDVEPLEGANSYAYLTRMKALGYRVVVNVGRLTVQKGLPNLLRAAKEVIERAPKTFFLFVGSGEQEQELIGLAAELGIARNVIFTGFQRGKRWRDAYAIGDLFVMPSISEPFGLTPLEAIGYGTPVLISKQSGVAEVLKNVLTVDFWDIDSMADQITAVVRHDALRGTLHANSLQEYQQLGWDRAADRLIALYHHLGRRMAVPV